MDALAANGGSAEQIAAMEQEYAAYHEERVLDRSKKFPNDIQLQFDLAELRFMQEKYEEARVIFQQISDNPQKHRACLVFLGKCELAMNNSAAAEPLLAEAVKEMYRMDKYRREALYYLALAYEGNGKKSEALECYKTIRANMENYRDISDRIAALTQTAESQA